MLVEVRTFDSFDLEVALGHADVVGADDGDLCAAWQSGHEGLQGGCGRLMEGSHNDTLGTHVWHKHRHLPLGLWLALLPLHAHSTSR